MRKLISVDLLRWAGSGLEVLRGAWRPSCSAQKMGKQQMSNALCPQRIDRHRTGKRPDKGGYRAVDRG